MNLLMNSGLLGHFWTGDPLKSAAILPKRKYIKQGLDENTTLRILAQQTGILKSSAALPTRLLKF
jgi:hypothetical protein